MKAKGPYGTYRGAEYVVDFLPKIKLEIAIDDSPSIKPLRQLSSASTGKIGDGKIFVLDVQEAIRVRTGEKGPEAL